MKFKKSLFLTLITILMTASFLAACSGSNGGSSSNGTKSNTENASKEEQGTDNAPKLYELGKEPLEFSLYGHYSWYTMPPWGGDVGTKWIQDNKKVTVKAISAGSDPAAKLNTMIATNALPDVIWLDRAADFERLREAGLLVALDEYIDKYPNLKQWLGDAGINILRAEDGHLYGFPNWYTNQPNGNAGYVINSKIYKDLGSPKLETTDDLYNYLKLVKEKFPKVIPYQPGLANDGQGIDVLYSAFKENDHKFPGMRAVPSGDKLTSIFTDPQFVEAMKYTSKLFREKLITQDAFTQTLDQITESVMTGNVAVYAGASPTDIAQKAHPELVKKDPDAGYFMVWPIHKEGLDKNKIFPGTYTTLGWNVAVITKAAENPEAIFAFLDWYTGPEGQTINFWGPEGKYWKGLKEDGITPIFTEEYINDVAGLLEYQGVSTNFAWVGNTVFADRTKADFDATLPEEQRNWVTKWQNDVTWKTQTNATEFINLNPVPNTDLGIIAKRIDEIYLQARAAAIYAKSDAEVEAILKKAEEDAMGNDYQKLLDFKTERWQENKKKIAGQ
ncbi:extracellular solute-binding protein [Paenibacillus aquistagni]|uniref:extracellular solute-binding protein n=1 Tax=Paenibacillus aquistagni TaxID=1852522 RepID=UPI00145C0D4F|nr:extracellular solute-binding protein [Paenibacillus aquistagni]NMM54426.1 extracellular solute-binding protein [Paenibacillus aquistagni]